ncbi:MAG: right-handed parallel beta-helix repeat-containing protein [Bacteroidales bacterium]|nr:right-handed parallel beta-helix repeat-containing protein [Bacteroidales bacterium]
MNKLSLSSAFLLLPFLLFSQTIIPGGNVNGTWTKAENPYLINGDIAVNSSDTLIIEPGVEVIFQDYYLFQVFGNLYAIGTETDSIRFTQADTTGYYQGNDAGWGGLNIVMGSNSELHYCIIEYSKASGILLYSSELNITHSYIHNNSSHGIYDLDVSDVSVNNVILSKNGGCGVAFCNGAEDDIVISDFVISGNYQGINCGQGTNADISNGIIKQNQAGGLWVGFESYPTIKKVLIVENNGGGIIASGGCSLENLTITNNIGVGISYDLDMETVEFSNSILWNNAQQEINDPNDRINIVYSDIQGGWTGIGNIDADPLFVDPINEDYFLTWANFPVEDSTKSPCIDSGDPGFAFDPDSTRVDMGVYYFDQGQEAYTLDLKIFLEGPYIETAHDMSTYLNLAGILPFSQPYNIDPWNYNGNESIVSFPNNEIVDWLLIELRDASDAADATSATTISRQAAFLKSDGFVVGLDGNNPLQFYSSIYKQLFAIVWHRNHISVMNAMPLVENEGVFLYDFSTDANKAYGYNNSQCNLGSGVWGMIAADGDANGQVDNKDKNDVWLIHANFNGYYSGDFNMDGNFDITDKLDYWIPNSGRSCQVPN